jgi:tetratricopeptide (TPR) repeat protein
VLLDRIREIYTGDKRDAEWQDYLKQVVTSAKERAPYAYVMAQFNEAHKTADGLTFLESLQPQRETDQDYLATLARLETEAGRQEKAVELYQKAIKAQPENPGANMALADLYDKMGKTDLAISQYKDILDKRDNSWIRTKYAGLLEKQGKKAEALEQYKAILKSDPASADAKSGISRLGPSEPAATEKK